MKKLMILLILFPMNGWAAIGPYFQHNDDIDQQEFELVYQTIQSIKPSRLIQKTLNSIQTSTAASVGLQYYCSNCTATPICVSTGTTLAGQFSASNNLTTKCQ